MYIFDQDLFDVAPRIVILANGEMPKPKSLAYRLLQASTSGNGYKLICCDGAYDQFRALDLGEPYAIVGDLDSIEDSTALPAEVRLVRRNDQETNDLSKAVDYARHQLGATSLTILASAGLREDHAIANISLLSSYVKEGLDYIIAPTEQGVFYGLRGSSRFHTRERQQISVFQTLKETAPISSKGLRWELRNALFGELWQGTLNEVVGEEFELESARPYLVYVSKQHK